MSPSGAAPNGALASFVRALWGLDVGVRALPAQASELAPQRPRFGESRIWLPASSPAGVSLDDSSYLLAATAHAAAHLRFGTARFLVNTLKPLQIALISLLEDARVERLAAQRYPGLARLWAPFHVARASGAKTSGALFARLARALHDDAYVDDDAWVCKGRALFFAQRGCLQDATLCRRIGDALANDLGQMRVQFNAKDYVVLPPYRDDHVGLWQLEQESAPDGSELETEAVRVTDTSASSSVQRPERSLPEPLDASGGSARAAGLGAERDAQQAEPIRHAEWDYVIARERAAFCTLRERTTLPAEPACLDAVLTRYAPVRRRLERSALRLASQRPVHSRRLTTGDRLDLPAVIAAVVARASGALPDPRVYRRARFQREPPALLLLLDLSESLNAARPGASLTLLDLARNASALLASTLSTVTRELAIHGFSSNGRHDVGYYRFKDFDEPYDERVRARLSGMRAGLSTRLGTALRHAGRELGARHDRRKLLLVLTDGEPADVDVHDPKYLLFEAKHATLRNRAQGVLSYCVGLDTSAESSIQRIFGRGNYLLLDQLEGLPEKLSQLYLRLAT